MNIGDKYKNFVVKKSLLLSEIGCKLLEFEHNPTGAKVLHLANDDPENVFCLSFQTIPENSNGVAHILEHTVLCGSDKFPVKDPFFAMTRRSLNTFMNAFTGQDFTCYPAASQVSVDFYNLMEVYIDAVFKPKLNELSFMQEGHRLEYCDSILEYKGVVFNEMKGAMSSPDSRLHEAIFETMFPGVTYGYNSGGDPKVIPQLTYQELLDFHKKYYHPSRCLFFFYGDMPIENHLDFIEDKALFEVQKLEQLKPLPKQPRFKEKKRAQIPYPTKDENSAEKNYISFAWLTCHILDQETFLAIEALIIALFGTDAAPLKKALVDSKLCKQVSASIESEMSEIPFILTLKGCKKENADLLEQLIEKKFKEMVSVGIPLNLLENAIHQIEFNRSEITGDGYPYGISLFLRAGLLRQQGGETENALVIHSLCDTLRKLIKEDENYIANIIKKYFIDNTHFVRMVAYPDLNLAEKEIYEEKKRLKEIEKGLSASKREHIIEKAEILNVYQKDQQNQDLEVLPKVTLADVPEKSKDYPLKKEKIGDTTLYHHDCFTNNIVYADLIFPLPYIAEKDLSYLHLFFSLIPQLGCHDRSWEENLDYIQENTGGVGACQSLNRQVENSEKFYPYFTVSGKSLYRKKDKLFPLLYQMVSSPKFNDKKRLKDIIHKVFTVLESTINQNALGYAIKLAASNLDVASRISQAWGGLEYYYLIKELALNFDDRADELIEKLIYLQNQILTFSDPHLVVTCTNAHLEELKKENFYGLDNLAAKNQEDWRAEYQLPKMYDQGKIIASPVAFSCQIFKTLSYKNSDAPYLSIAAHLFDRLTLHPQIREIGGAYGAHAINNALNGNFCFYSYRDPNISRTFAAFDESVKMVTEGKFSITELEESKLEIIQNLDTPISPGSRGELAYIWLREGKNLEARQQWRDRVLNATIDDVLAAVKKHITSKMDQANRVVFAGKELMEKENSHFTTLGKKALKIEQI